MICLRDKDHAIKIMKMFCATWSGWALFLRDESLCYLFRVPPPQVYDSMTCVYMYIYQLICKWYRIRRLPTPYLEFGFSESVGFAPRRLAWLHCTLYSMMSSDVDGWVTLRFHPWMEDDKSNRNPISTFKYSMVERWPVLSNSVWIHLYLCYFDLKLLK